MCERSESQADNRLVECTSSGQDEKHEIIGDPKDSYEVSRPADVEQEERKLTEPPALPNDEEFSVFRKKSYASVKRMLHDGNQSRADESFDFVEKMQSKRNSLDCTIDLQLFAEHHVTSTDTLNKESEVSRVSDQPESEEMQSVISNIVRIEDIDIIQGNFDDKDNFSKRSFHLTRKGSIEKSDLCNPDKDLEAVIKNKRQHDGAKPDVKSIRDKEKLARLENSPIESACAARNVLVQGPEQHNKENIVIEKFEHDLKTSAGSTPVRLRTVNNIDNAPRLWKALPFPREHLDEHSMKKLNEEDCYHLAGLWLTVARVLCALIPLAAVVVTLTFGLSWSFEIAMSWLVVVVLALVIQVFIVEVIFLFFHTLYFALWLKRPLDEGNLLHELMNKVWIHEDDGTYFVDDLDDRDLSLIPRPPTLEERLKAREKAGRDRELEQVLVMIVFDILFLLLLVIIGLGNRDHFSYPMKANIENIFNSNDRFMKVSF